MIGNNGKVLLSHGAGGRLSQELIEKYFLKPLENPALSKLDDSALLQIERQQLAFTTDAFVVRPIFFPGGDIGKLSVCGTINDLAMVGAMPEALSVAIILEEGLEFSVLEKVVSSIQNTAQACGVSVVCGDTKVVEKGFADQLYIVTAGVGRVISRKEISASNAQEGDAVLLSGTIADHGVSVLQARGDFELQGKIESDCNPLNELVKILLEVCPDTHTLRDPTRGGISTTLNEIAKASKVKIEIEEKQIPIRSEVQAACNLLGIDPLYLASEGRFLAFVPKKFAEKCLTALRQHPLGKDAAKIGKVVRGKPGVEMTTAIGGRRPLRMLEGESLPRIC